MISIAMATFNGERFIKEQIDSILGQTVQDFELVVCDDCSTDGTWRILMKYANDDTRIHIFRNETNVGFKKNFERIIGLTKGEYVALCDQDDIWYPNHLEILLAEMKGDVQLVCGRPIFVDGSNIELPTNRDYLKLSLPPTSNEDHARHIFLGESTYQGASMLLRRSFLNTALPIPEKSNFHDSWFAALACFMGGIVYIDRPVMRYRRLEESVTIKSNRVYTMKRFVWHIIKKNVLLDRPVFIFEIKKRLTTLTHSQLILLYTFEKMHKRQKYLLGRILNIPYRLRYYKAIYAGNFWS